MVRFGKCCNPLPGDAISGYITRGRGVTVHTADCPNILGSDPERLIQVSWNLQEKAVHAVRVRVTCNDKKGLLADISSGFGLLGSEHRPGRCDHHGRQEGHLQL